MKLDANEALRKLENTTSPFLKLYGRLTTWILFYEPEGGENT